MRSKSSVIASCRYILNKDPYGYYLREGVIH